MTKKEKDFIEDLKDIGLNIPDDLRASIHNYSIELELYQNNTLIFGSDVTVYYSKKNSIHGERKSINFGTSGSFSPTDIGPYWRTKIAAQILENWDNVMQLVHFYLYDYETEN